MISAASGLVTSLLWRRPRYYGGKRLPSEEEKYEECEKMSLDSEEGTISSKDHYAKGLESAFPMRASCCSDPGRVVAF